MRHTGFTGRLIYGKPCGFTLAELLIALVILGLIATFTIPKVLQSQSSSANSSIAKETVAMLSGAYEAYKSTNSASGSTKFEDLTPYMNYVTRDTTSTMNQPPNWFGPSVNCSGGTVLCLRLHNGGTFVTDTNRSFGGSTNLNALIFYVDPDSKLNSVEAVGFALYYNGMVRTYGSAQTGTDANGLSMGPDPTVDPAWFNWN